MPLNQSGNSLIKSSVDLMGLAASGAVGRLGCGCCSGNRCRMGAGLSDGDGTVHLHNCKFLT